jgi:hypothetical protein
MEHTGGRDPLEVTVTLKAFIERYSAKQTEQTTEGKEGEGKKKKRNRNYKKIQSKQNPSAWWQ